MASWMQGWRPRANKLCDFSSPCLWNIAPATKKWYQVTQSAALSRKIISANLKSWCSKMQPLSGNQRPDLLTSLMKMSPVLHLPSDIHLCRASSKASRLPTFLKLLQNRHVLLTFDKVRNPFALATPNDVWKSKSALYPSVFYTFDMDMLLRATMACTFSTSQLPKVVRRWCVLYILTWTCASRRHNGVHFFDISTSKSGLDLVCFVHFDFEVCFAPQWRALFRHRNFQKWSKVGVFCTFWKRASRYNGVQFFIFHLARWLRTRRFSEPTFRPSGATNHWKNTMNCHFPTFSRICVFFFLTLSLLWSFLGRVAIHTTCNMDKHELRHCSVAAKQGAHVVRIIICKNIFIIYVYISEYIRIS